MPAGDPMLWLVPAFFAGAVLYALVGYGGVTAWLATGAEIGNRRSPELNLR